ncbi:MAG TPA: FadR/GntR family transcriptional regulator [Rubrobacter sp.]|nr:FadR/GntR family transcriptional regulator [Rubrobacter sp.]
MALTDDAITSIKQMILSGQVGPGEKLPREKELATRLGLSRSSLREAVRALILAGVLKTRQGDGTYVTSLEPHQLLETMSLAVDLMQNRTLVELFEVRRMIEPAATALAAGRIDKEDLRRLEETLGRMDAAENVEELVEADDDFHRTVAGATGNAALAAFLQNLYGRTLRARIWRGLAEEGALDRTRISHRAIYGAISNRDAELARSAATMHIAEVEAWFRRLPEVASSNKERGGAREAPSP